MPSMHMKRLGACRGVQTIDVLSDDQNRPVVFGLQPCQCKMRCIWFGCARILPAHIVEGMHLVGVFGKAFGCGHLFQIDFGPKTVLVPECSKPAFGRHTGACQNDNLHP